MRPHLTTALTCALTLITASTTIAQTPTPPPYVAPVVPPAKNIAVQACNYSNGPISIAVAYEGKTAGTETVFGWYGIAVQKCQLVGPFPFTSGRFAFWATRRGDDGDKTNGLYCVDHEKSYTLEDGHRKDMKATCPAGMDIQAFDIVKADPKLPAQESSLYAWDFYP